MTLPKLSLLDVADLATDRVQHFNGIRPYVATGDLHDDGRLDSTPVTYDERPSRADLQVQDGDVCMARMRDTMKVREFTESDGLLILSTGFVILRPRIGRLAPEYLRNYLRSQAFQAAKNRLCTGAVQPALTNRGLAELEIPLPPIEEQRRIAAILDAADSLRTERREAIAKLDTLAQTIFSDMFGDPVTNDRGWPLVQLDELCRGIFDCPHSTPRWTDVGKICLRSSNLGKGVWNWTDTRYVSPETFEERSKRSQIEAGDIILSREGTVGIAAIVQAGMQVCMGQRLVQVRPNPDLVSSDFLLAVLLFLLQPDRIGRVMAGSTSKHLNVRDLRDLAIINPPMREQNRYLELVVHLTERRMTMNRASSELDTLLASLQQRAFRGEL